MQMKLRDYPLSLQLDPATLTFHKTNDDEITIGDKNFIHDLQEAVCGYVLYWPISEATIIFSYYIPQHPGDEWFSYGLVIELEEPNIELEEPDIEWEEFDNVIVFCIDICEDGKDTPADGEIIFSWFDREYEAQEQRKQQFD